MRPSAKSSAPLPPSLADLAARRLEALADAARDAALTLPGPSAWPGEVARVWACSSFVAHSCTRDPLLLAELLASGDLAGRRDPAQVRGRLAASLAEAETEEALMAALRRARLREWVRIAWRDIGGMADLDETVADLSAFADAALEEALARLDGWQSEALGEPVDAGGRRQFLVVLAMGKLGARELNFSSDIDLIFAFPEQGETRGAARAVSNEEYFMRLGRRLINVLGAATAEGFVFRVDMRLRPFGNSGPLAMSFNAVEDYYQTHGRDWERYALIRARAAAGDLAAGERLLARLRPFVFRRYVDFGALESLRDMKKLIVQEVSRKGMEHNVKLGPGGIREVEFVCQAFQMVRGGRAPELRDRHLLTVLGRLGAARLLPDFAVVELGDAYRFLRTVEHRLQEADDRQLHTLPVGEDERTTLAAAMGRADWPALARELDDHRARVRDHFDQIFAATEAEAGGAGPDLEAVWEGAVDADTAHAQLAAAGFDDPAQALALVAGLRDAPALRHLSKRGRDRLHRLMPLLLGAAGARRAPAATLRRVLQVIEAIARRSVYLSLLVERPLALSQLVRLCAASPWIARQLARLPLLLDELLDARTLYAPLDRAALEADLANRLEGLAEGDTEAEMDALREFKQANVLRVAAADVAKVMPLMVVSDHLTEIAEVALDAVLRCAWADLTARHGAPHCVVDGTRRPAGFAIIAYGKLGGIELGYGSDLDLVFLHGSRGEAQQTDGERALENAVFFGRLGRRIIHYLSAHTSAGVLYEVDPRLRPSGKSGLLVSGIEAFDTYQHEDAWTWEHQALVRARPVAGDPELARRFTEIRRDVLLRTRDPEALRTEVREMRERMRAELGSRQAGCFDLKQDPGGIADIEFMVQYGALRWAPRLGDFLRYTDNIRLLEGFAAGGLMPRVDVDVLADAYRRYRARVHALALQEAPALVSDDAFKEERRAVTLLWQRLLGQ